MSTLIKIVIVVVALGSVGAAGYHYLVQSSTTVQVQVAPPAELKPPPRDHGDIDRLAPVQLPGARAPAQQTGNQQR